MHTARARSELGQSLDTEGCSLDPRLRPPPPTLTPLLSTPPPPRTRRWARLGLWWSATAATGELRELLAAVMTSGNPSDDVVAEAMAALDENHDGLISKAEFRKWYLASEALIHAEVKATFERFDEDGSGYISKSEVKNALFALGETDVDDATVVAQMREMHGARKVRACGAPSRPEGRGTSHPPRPPRTTGSRETSRLVCSRAGLVCPLGAHHRASDARRRSINRARACSVGAPPGEGVARSREISPPARAAARALGWRIEAPAVTRQLRTELRVGGGRATPRGEGVRAAAAAAARSGGR